MTTTTIEIGKKAPDFKVLDDNNAEVSLKDFKGKNVVLYFYPKDNTPGCTCEAEDFTSSFQKFKKKNTMVLGVSRDTVSSHQKFKEKFSILYPLLADTDEALCTLYAVIKNKNMYGKQVRGIERSTFLIDENQKIKKIWRNVKVAGHVDEVLAELE